MNDVIQPSNRARVYSIPQDIPSGTRLARLLGTTRTTETIDTLTSRFFAMLANTSQDVAAGTAPHDTTRTAVPSPQTRAKEAVAINADTDAAAHMEADAYKAYLEKRFGPVTIQSIPKDQASLEAAGKHMSGSDVIIAPNIFADMVADPQKAAYYEQKISYFFTDVIPQGKAFAASVGLTFEPCGVVIHEDGTVTYICGGGDPPERVAEVNRINQEKAAKKAAQQKLRQAQATAAAAKSQAMQIHSAPVETQATAVPYSEPDSSDWLRMQMLSRVIPPVVPVYRYPPELIYRFWI